MRRENTHPAYWPPELPGYIPFNNNSTHDDAKIEAMLAEADIPLADAITLREIVPGVASTTYVRTMYEPVIVARSRRIYDLLNMLMRAERNR